MTPDAAEESPDERFTRELNARVAFEQMLAATVKIAAVSAPVYWSLSLIAASAEGAFLSRLPSVAIGGISLAAAVFLGGFVAALALGVPLFLLLERLKLRRGLHYVLGGLLANSIVYIILAGRPPSVQNPAEYLYLAPGVAIAALFLQRMKPYWRAYPASPAAAANVIRLH